MNFRLLTAAALLGLAPALAQNVTGPIVQFQTNLGNINVTLRPDVAPNTVANFLNYVNTGGYTATIIHRNVAGFVIQGGGWQLINGTPTQLTANAAVNNECPVAANGVPQCALSNIRGTIAMAKASGMPNSATDEWYFNVANNSSTLDFQNGGYTVFGQVADAASQTVIDQINALPVCDESGIYYEFSSLPYLNSPGTCSTAIPAADYVVVNAITQVQAVPTIAKNGIVTASAFGGYIGAAAPGSYVEIYGNYLAGSTDTWASFFTGNNAPTSLDNVTVTLNGTPAYVNYVSPTQVNIQVPDNIPAGMVSVVVNFGGLVSTAGTLNITSTEPGLLAPASFLVGGKQYIAAVHGANPILFVSGGNIPGLPTAPAKSGETLILYGTGFGPLQSGTKVAGVIASGLTTLANPFAITIGGFPATVSYQGLTPGLVGVYQFNIVVPQVFSAGDAVVQYTLNGFFPPAGQSKLYLSVTP